MTEKKLSTLSYFMDRLSFSTAGLARRLYVDASLVGKWRSSSRRLNVESVYFERTYAMLLEQDDAASDDVPHSLILLRNSEGSPDTAVPLRRALTDRHFTIPRALTLRAEVVCTAKIVVYTNDEGRRQAISGLLDVAEVMEMPGEMLYMDSEQNKWLLEDPVYAQERVGRMPGLLDRGFTFQAALRFSVSMNGFVSFFHLCSLLIFHRSAHWFYHQYYGESIYWLSFSILEYTMNVSGMSISTEQISTMAYMDTYLILQHRDVFYIMPTDCRPMFTDLSIDMEREAVSELSSSVRQNEKLLSCLLASVFMAVRETLPNGILQENETTGQAASRCREINRLLRAMMERHLVTGEEIIQILQLDETRHRIRICYINTSLSLICKKQVVIFPIHCARGLEESAGHMERYPFCHLLLIDGMDHTCLPDISCQCHGTSWMVQMDTHGFRVCRESTLSGTAYIALEQGWHRVPPSRKGPTAVLFVLRSLITYIEDRTL